MAHEQDWVERLDRRLLDWFWRPGHPRRGLLGWGHLALQAFYLAIRSAYLDRLPFQASALTFMTLLSLVPALAISFALAKGLGYANQLEKFLLSSEFTSNQAEVFRQIMEYVQRTQVGTLGVVGVVVLVATLVITLSSVEETFNRVWEVRVQRNWVRKFTDYLSVLVVVPLFVLAATTIWAALSSLHVVKLFQEVALVGEVTRWGLSLGPLLLLSAAFVFIYLFLPNTSIPIWSAVLAGVVAACMWWGVQSVYIYFQIGVARYNAIYGGFASLPLFFVWLQVSWMVLLFGNQLARAHHECCCEALPRAVQPRLSGAQREALGLRLVYLVAQRFHRGEPPWALGELAVELNAPVRQVQHIIANLVEAGLLARAEAADQVLPGRSLDSLLVADVLLAMRGQPEPLPDAPALDQLLRRTEQAGFQALGQTSLLDLMQD